MDIGDFKRILRAFADEQDDVDVRQGKVVASIRDDIVDANLRYGDDHALLVEENGQAMHARTWLLTRVAKLPQLADRILASIPDVMPFVRPAGRLMDDLASSQLDAEQEVTDVFATLQTRTNANIPGATSVLYLTSDAGEGKTTLISLVARAQAKLLKEQRVLRLLVPIPLGGRAFLTFDDAVVAALVNKLRFPYLYYGAFLELVKLGAVVPAFDGYEEMLVESNRDEAVSALGDLVRSLDSRGAIVVAARKAFFEYQSFRTQARLLDALGDHSVSFARLKIDRWDMSKFCEYGRQRGVTDPEEIYGLVAARVTENHPLLTRAVLVRRLFDISIRTDSREQLLAQLAESPEDFFYTFVNVIITREANEKWLNRASDVGESLISVEEHHQLLRMLALEMWQTSSRTLRFDIVDLLVDLFCEASGKNSLITRQIKERIKQHSLLIVENTKGQAVAFDHEDFQSFFLGEGLGAALTRGQSSELRSLLGVNILPTPTAEQAVRAHRRFGGTVGEAALLLQKISDAETGYTYAKENCGALLAWLMDRASIERTRLEIRGATLPVNSLAGKKLHSVLLSSCTMQPTALGTLAAVDVRFESCHFERIDIEGSLEGLTFHDCLVDSLIQGDAQLFEPTQIKSALKAAGALVSDGSMGAPEAPAELDDRVWQLERFLRVFLRSTHVDEEVIRLRLGRAKNPEFFNQILPDLIDLGLLQEVPWKGGGIQRRFKLNVPLFQLQEALQQSNGDYDTFLMQLRTRLAQ
ncbi:hypothetical protein [Ramlibacter montanisoli]|uniref:NACHT domain-containing protein n=1 Tax=Ramlibacter montanisoli TaxID=2732512 RepID=A0A849KBQ7_9BURK|nr:hypothetical protein [Ramlibacter montanisoli]NNU44850.1 hypothetical protein [Ramlibacter montanisoli]